MQRQLPWLWIALAALLLLAPGTFGRLFLDVAEGLTLTFLLLPLILAVGGFVAWRWLQSRIKPCPACGFPSAAFDICPACGSALGRSGGDSSGDIGGVDASSATIDVEAVDVDAKP